MAALDRLFLLSPAHCGGERARMLRASPARFDLACRLRTPAGAPLGEVMSFLSGLYFRGKLAYAAAFGTPLVITPGSGLVPADTPVTVEVLDGFAAIEIDARNGAYRAPLEASTRRLPRGEDVVLLGSIASGKYVDVLSGLLGPRLLFPSAFVGRGDMSRGGLLLRAVRAGQELDYMPVIGSARRGTRPPRLTPLRRATT
jgi:hypothetical protein